MIWIAVAVVVLVAGWFAWDWIAAILNLFGRPGGGP